MTNIKDYYETDAKSQIIHEKVEKFVKDLSIVLPNYDDLPDITKERIMTKIYNLIGESAREMLDLSIKVSYDIVSYKKIPTKDEIDKEKEEAKKEIKKELLHATVEEFLSKFPCNTERANEEDEYLKTAQEVEREYGLAKEEIIIPKQTSCEYEQEFEMGAARALEFLKN